MKDDEVLIGGIEKVDIKIVDYQPHWFEMFEQHRRKIKNALGPEALQIEHIGSTSVPELAAKPIIDIVVVVNDSADEGSYLQPLLDAGYQLRVREPLFFEHRMVRTPERDVHIHIFSAGCQEVERYLLLRNYLRVNPEARSEYETIKRKFAQRSWEDMNAYAQAKTDFIENLIRLARESKIQI
ncbi:GrpB family protein [Pseudoalteromonas sp. S16_S37]|uniref:GrpB family protein n=1 Tax=Pseudoalteromonas sp. S16_S37 TaxID=2720228 RepID=UPI00168063EA|nr:GrpB family protein [Pseudoalteromonas sp. S16_S37]MBD1583324.1 GrpB family protein [Pseudoalteromonas sp. S16_S37]